MAYNHIVGAIHSCILVGTSKDQRPPSTSYMKKNNNKG